MATNNYYTFKCENEKEAEKRASKRRKKIFFTALGAVAATAGAAYLYNKGFSNGAEKMKDMAQKVIEDTANFGAVCGYARARLDDGSLDESSVKEFLSACADELIDRGLMSPGAVTAEEIETISKHMIGQ